MSAILRTAQELITTNEERAAGFALYADRRNQELKPYIRRASLVRSWVSRTIAEPSHHYSIPAELAVDLAMAAGISVKAQSHVSPDFKATAIAALLDAAQSSKESESYILHRFLLSAGDALGGKMRNIVGSIADVKFKSAFVATLTREKGISAIDVTDDRRVVWSSSAGMRIMQFNKLLTATKKNQDVVVTDDSEKLIAVGELKGGIDPAGADEHWKTARTSLNRVRVACGANVKIFFAGSAIEAAMADEIVQQLASGSLNFASNLGKQEQLIELCEWLATL
jgi:type II restriction enzyme